MTKVLDKFGVPLPSGRNMCMKMPKQQHKFRVVMSNFGLDLGDSDVVAIDVESVDRPKINYKVQSIPYFGSTVTRVVGFDWSPIVLTVRDSVDNGIAKVISKQHQKQMDFNKRITDKSVQEYASYKFKMMIETTSGANPDDTLTNFTHDTIVDMGIALTENMGFVNALDDFLQIKGYNAVGSIDRWCCFGCTLVDVDWGTLDYTSSDTVEIKLTIKPDNCVQYDVIKEMYADRIHSLLPDWVDKGLDVIDNLFG